MHDEEEGPSKSAVKREMTALQKVGEELVGLSERELARMPIESEQLAEAIALARRINSNSGRRRQLQYIGKLMRRIDPDPLIKALERLHEQGREDAERFHQLEQLRDTLLSAEAGDVEAALAIYPDADRQQLRQLQRQHHKEKANNKPPAASRKLFKYLRELSESQAD